MPSEIAEVVYVVVATKDGNVEYWAVASPYEEVLDAMARATGPGWKYSVTTEWLTVERAAELGLPLEPIRRIGPSLPA
jgi:predicted transcriptional regulator YdeE